MKFPFAGGTGQQDSKVFDASRAINCYPIPDATGTEQVAMYGTEGLTLFGQLGSGGWREVFTSRANGRMFGVSGLQLFEIFNDGTGTARGNLLTSSGIVYMEENATQLGVCDGNDLYIMDYTTNVFQRIAGGVSYIANGDFASGSSGWTIGSGWTAITGYGYAVASSAALTRAASNTLIQGKTYVLKYSVSTVAFVKDGTFTDAANWTLGSGWTVENNTAVATGAISTAITQNSPATLVSGRVYTVTFTVVRTAGSVAVSLGGGSAGTSRSASGTYTEDITAGATQVVSFAGTGFTGNISAITIYPKHIGSVQPSVGGTNGVARSAAGNFTESFVAGATQNISFTGSGFTGTISSITLEDLAFGLPSPVGTLDVIDSFFIVSKKGTRQFYKSAANNGMSWNALDFASKSAQPDNLARVKQAVGQLWLFGQYSSEVWTNTGASSFPFSRISGAKLTVGILAPDTAMELDNSVFWLGQDQSGNGIVYRASGFTPQRISTTAIERMIAMAPNKDKIRACVFQREGHLFYMLVGDGLETSPVYDITTQIWHERAYLEESGLFSRYRAEVCTFNGTDWIMGDYENNNLYKLDPDAYTDNGNPVVFERITQTITNENKRTRYNMLNILLENAVGNDDAPDPKIELYVSRDGGRTWIGVEITSMGAIGATQTQVIFRNLGVAQTLTFKIRISDPVRRRIVGAYLQ